MIRPVSLLLVLSCLAILIGDTVDAQTTGSIRSEGRVVTTTPHEMRDIVKKIVGREHALALRSDGLIVAWGENVYGECDVPEPNTDFIDIAMGNDISYGLKSNGTIVYWGYARHGSEEPPEPNTDFVSIAAAREAVFALRSDGGLVGFGQLYDRGTVPEPNIGFTSFGIGNNFVVALRADTSVEVWGEPGRLDGWLPPEPNSGFVKISVGANHWVGLRDDGTAVEVGYRPAGAPVPPTLPVPNGDFVGVAALPAATWLLDEDGAMTGWSTYSLQFLGPPQPNQNFESLIGLENYLIATRQDGTEWLSGNYFDDPVNGPYPNVGVVDVSLSEAIYDGEGLALFEDGTLAAWGRTTYSPTHADPIVAIDSGKDFHLALDEAGQVYDFFWADNEVPDMGSGPGNKVIAISAGYDHRLALQQDGDVIAWGSNYNGQCEVPVFTSPAVAISAGGKHSVALLEDGSIIGWGEDYYGQAADQPPGWGPDFISAGFDHTVAMTPSGTILGWGNNSEGQLDFPYPNGNWAAAEAGYGFTVGIRKDGTIEVLGADYNGLRDLVAEEPEFLAFSATRRRSAVVIAMPAATGVSDPVAPSRIVRILGATPNPFNPSTKVEFTVPAGQPMVLNAYDVRGRLIGSLFEGVGSGYPEQFIWRPDGQASGVYFLRIESGGDTDVIKTLLLK